MILRRNLSAVQFSLPPGTKDKEIISSVLSDFKTKCKKLAEEGIYNTLGTYEVFRNRYMTEWTIAVPKDEEYRIYQEIPHISGVDEGMFGLGEFPLVSIYRKIHPGTGKVLVAYTISR